MYIGANNNGILESAHVNVPYIHVYVVGLGERVDGVKAKKRTKKPLDGLDDGLTISPASMKVLTMIYVLYISNDGCCCRT